jgi:signal transduction histidine kinase
VEDLIGVARTTRRIRSVFGARLALFGEAGQYNLHAVPLDPRFPEASLLLVVEDLSEVGALESQLLRAEKLATVGVLAAGIAHEIGTPLSVVRGRAELILGKLGRDHPQIAAVGVIISQIDYITRTIRQLLDFSRSQPGHQRAVQVRVAAEAVCELLRWEAERRKVTLTLDVPEPGLRVTADPDQLQQLLVNLVLNACDACRSGGVVQLAAARAGDREVCLQVIDDGCGIDPAQREQVFDPFYTTKKRGHGTGLGLTIAARIARDHSARIELESVVGRGTRFSVYWPAAGEVRDAAAG